MLLKLRASNVNNKGGGAQAHERANFEPPFRSADV